MLAFSPCVTSTCAAASRIVEATRSWSGCRGAAPGCVDMTRDHTRTLTGHSCLIYGYQSRRWDVVPAAVGARRFRPPRSRSSRSRADYVRTQTRGEPDHIPSPARRTRTETGSPGLGCETPGGGAVPWLVTTHRTAIPLRAGRANDRPGCEELLNGVLSGGET